MGLDILIRTKHIEEEDWRLGGYSMLHQIRSNAYRAYGGKSTHPTETARWDLSINRDGIWSAEQDVDIDVHAFLCEYAHLMMHSDTEGAYTMEGKISNTFLTGSLPGLVEDLEKVVNWGKTQPREMKTNIESTEPPYELADFLSQLADDDVFERTEFFYSLAKKALEGEGSLHFH